MTREVLQLSELTTKIVSKESFLKISPSPDRLQQLVYSMYTESGEPEPVTPPETSYLSELYENSDKRSAYILATGEAESFFHWSANGSLRKIGAELCQFKSLAGFMKVEWGVYETQKNLPLEAMVLTKNYPWPEKTIVGYAASFTINPLIPRSIRLDIQRNMHRYLYALAAMEEFSDQIYTILAPHVVSFVEASGLTPTKLPVKTELNYEDAYAARVFRTFPKYWNTSPSIYKFNPHIHHDGRI
jgi:hypothetical protein